MKYLFLLFFIILTSCSKKTRTLQNIKEEGILRVATRNSPTSYYEDRDGNLAGFEYETIKSFASWLGVKVEYIILDSPKELLYYLEHGEVDIVAAGMSITDSRKKKFLFGSPYMVVTQEVVCHKDHLLKETQDLVGKTILISKGSSYIDDLNVIKKKYPKLLWKTSSELSHYQLFEDLENKVLDCTVVDSNILSLYQRYFPDLRNFFSIGKEKKLAWVLDKKSKALQVKVGEWFSKELSRGQIQVWKDKYYGHAKEFDPYDIKKFVKRIQTRLPKYKDQLQKAASLIGWDWRLLAAISYQESHWNPRAKSPTGVRGFMMLTLATAKQLKIKNRLDAEQSIMGGARYLKKIEERIPSYITGIDRKWMTLASYNVGYAHVRDAWGVAAWFEKNPNKWSSLSAVLPKLSQRKIYKRLPHGYARGLEPVIYVNRIRNYYDLLKRELSTRESKK
jgi:membrane-bound lytic murein transglycosylase F